MNPELIVALASVVLALASGIASARTARRSREFEAQLERQRKEEDAAAAATRVRHQYRDPLLDAAQTLQSRIFNVVANATSPRTCIAATPTRNATRATTPIYAFAEYMCWVEIVRRELRFLDVGDLDHNRQLLAQLTQTQVTLQSDRLHGPFRVFRGRQRAIAELMMVPTGAHEGPRNESIGYAAFCRRLDDDAAFAAWFGRLREDVEAAVSRDRDDRLIRLQHDLIDLIDHLDPKSLRIPPEYRKRLNQQSPIPVPAQP